MTILVRMKMGHTAVSDIESSSVTLKTLRKEPEKNTVILNIFTRQLTQRLINLVSSSFPSLSIIICAIKRFNAKVQNALIVMAKYQIDPSENVVGVNRPMFALTHRQKKNVQVHIAVILSIINLWPPICFMHFRMCLVCEGKVILSSTANATLCLNFNNIFLFQSIHL